MTVFLAGIAERIILNITAQEDIGFQIKRLFSLVFVVILVILMLVGNIAYISRLQKRLRQQMNEYFNLINRIHEGVLVIVRDSRDPVTSEIKFYNKSCLKIFKRNSFSNCDDKEL